MEYETRLILEVGERQDIGNGQSRAVPITRDITAVAQKDQLSDLYSALLRDEDVCWFRTYDQARVILPDGEVLTGQPKNHSPMTVVGQVVAIERANLPKWVKEDKLNQGVTHIGVPTQAEKSYQFLKPATGDRVVNALGHQIWPEIEQNQNDNVRILSHQRRGMTA